MARGGDTESRIRMAENDVKTTPIATTGSGWRSSVSIDFLYVNSLSMEISTRCGSNGLMMKSFAPLAIASNTIFF